MLKISSIVIGVKSLNQSRSFYEHVLGISFSEFRPPFASFFLDGIEFNIEENSEHRDSSWVKNYIGGRKAIAFAVNDIEQFLANVKAFNGQIVQHSQKKPWGWIEAVIADPDGNEFLIEQKV